MAGLNRQRKKSNGNVEGLLRKGKEGVLVSASAFW